MDTEVQVIDGVDGFTPEMLRRRRQEKKVWTLVNEFDAGREVVVTSQIPGTQRVIQGWIAFVNGAPRLVVGSQQHLLIGDWNVTFID